MLCGQYQPRGQARSKALRKSSTGNVEQHSGNGSNTREELELTKDEFVENIAEMAIKENHKTKQGERTYLNIFKEAQCGYKPRWLCNVERVSNCYEGLQLSPEEAEA